MERALTLERGRIDLETGEFPLIAVTNGEASDGHILHLPGMEVADRTPMFVNHFADPTMRMGGLHSPKVSGKVTQLGKARLHMTGVIDMKGDSILADIRRDVAQGVHVGDITAMSVRWDEIEPPVARASLAKNHYAHSEAGADAWNTPMFFESSRMLETSIVGVGADAAAIIGRSQDTGRPQHVRDFWRVLIEETVAANPYRLRLPSSGEKVFDIEAQMNGDIIQAMAEKEDRELMACSTCAAREAAEHETETREETIEADPYQLRLPKPEPEIVSRLDEVSPELSREYLAGHHDALCGAVLTDGASEDYSKGWKVGCRIRGSHGDTPAKRETETREEPSQQEAPVQPLASDSLAALLASGNFDRLPKDSQAIIAAVREKYDKRIEKATSLVFYRKLGRVL